MLLRITIKYLTLFKLRNYFMYQILLIFIFIKFYQTSEYRKLIVFLQTNYNIIHYILSIIYYLDILTLISYCLLFEIKHHQ